MIRLFMREDVYGQFVTCLAFFPRDIYTTELRLKVERVLKQTSERGGYRVQYLLFRVGAGACAVHHPRAAG